MKVLLMTLGITVVAAGALGVMHARVSAAAEEPRTTPAYAGDSGTPNQVYATDGGTPNAAFDGDGGTTDGGRSLRAGDY